MRSLFVLFCLSSTIAVEMVAQTPRMRVSYTNIGTSAISVNTITAKTFNFTCPIYDYKSDSIGGYLFVSGRQKDEGSGNYLRGGFCTSINHKKDTLLWLIESGVYDINVTGKNLIISNDLRSARFNKNHGFDELKYDSRVFYTVPKLNKGLMYDRGESEVLNCIDLATGVTTWTCTIPRKADWVDVRHLNDSVLLVAANGIHALNLNKGLMWSVPLTTFERTNRSLIYSRAKYNTIQNLSHVYRTALEENVVTQLASNILVTSSAIYFATKERFVALDHKGKQIWQLDMKNYPVSKMLISPADSSLILANFGLAKHSTNFVTWGRPFVITINPSRGSIIDQYDLSNIENLADFIISKNSLIFAGRDDILEAVPGKPQLNNVVSLNKNKFGQFVDFVDGNEYYILKEGYYVPLNFINDNLIYFRADNNKVYGIDGENLLYEYHYTELFRFDKKHGNKTILMSPTQTLITNNNFELLFTIDLSLPNVIVKDKMYFIDKTSVHVIDLENLK